LSKTFKWKRNVTGDFKADGFCHLGKTANRPQQIPAHVNVYKIIRAALTATERSCFGKRVTDSACAFLYLQANRL